MYLILLKQGVIVMFDNIWDGWVDGQTDTACKQNCIEKA